MNRPMKKPETRKDKKKATQNKQRNKILSKKGKRNIIWQKKRKEERTDAYHGNNPKYQMPLAITPKQKSNTNQRNTAKRLGPNR